jgi:succinate dehydrogenase/fumarate reductase flavoprotein subunit
MIYEYDAVIVGGIAGLVSALEDEGYESYIEE